nr:immunoglobulin light chain junction region [Macaca mulatta]MOW15709.1 immunoglobulin light chain junction region [Macaca mulatta]MOW16045.1 immunoglobulin light chain junction region [Macaca mulatta]MOW18451.1 immunoglobulin light chain junction region [Macaca mulatta]
DYYCVSWDFTGTGLF